MSSIQSNFTQLQSLNKTHLVLDNKFHQNNGKKIVLEYKNTWAFVIQMYRKF